MEDVLDLPGAVRLTARVEEYRDGRTPGDGMPPDNIVEVEIFQERDGTVITDPVRIAEVRDWISEHGGIGDATG